MDRLSTERVDSEGNTIHDGDILLNPFAGDLWLVYKDSSGWNAGLIPNSGFIRHEEKYPQFAYVEDLNEVCENFRIYGNKDDNPYLLDGTS